jgi:hypothetical protein
MRAGWCWKARGSTSSRFAEREREKSSAPVMGRSPPSWNAADEKLKNRLKLRGNLPKPEKRFTADIQSHDKYPLHYRTKEQKRKE